VAWSGVQPSPLGGGEASTAQEPQPDQEDDILEVSEPTPPKPSARPASSSGFISRHYCTGLE